MNLSGLEVMIPQRLGLDPEALGAAALRQAIARRAAALGVAANDYPAIMSADPAEQQAFAAELVVPETWFFRGGRRLFDTLAGFASAHATGTPVRILSVPCSTGEEPYSLAIALHDRGVSHLAYEIEGVDLSAAHVDRARAGRFSTFAFRDIGLDFRAHYFRQFGDRWELHSNIRESVRFRTGNVADPDFLAKEAPFELVLCRNLFIYLTSDARRQALANLDRLLTPGGWLVLSPAEADRLPPGRFVASGPPEFGVYRRGEAREAFRPIIREPEVRPNARTTPPPMPVMAQAVQPEHVPRSEPVLATATLEMARELADAGRLGEARAACARLIDRNVADPDIYSLLGVVRLAQGAPEDAAVAFRKALYLDPNHAEAIGHMIVICIGRGDAAQAISLRRRLARLVAKEQS